MRLDTSSAKDEKDLDSGFNPPAPGKYLAIVKNAQEFPEFAKDRIVIEFDVIDGSVPGQSGKNLSEFFAVSEKAMKRLNRLAVKLDLIKPGETKDVNFADAIGAVLVIDVENHEWNDEKTGQKKSGVRLMFNGFNRVSDPDSAEFMKIAPVRAAYQAITAAVSQQQAAPNTAAQPAKSGTFSF